MSQSYIEAHKAEEAVRALEQKVSLLMTKNREQAGKNESFEKKIQGLEKKTADLDTRLKASYVFSPLPFPNSPFPSPPFHSPPFPSPPFPSPPFPSPPFPPSVPIPYSSSQARTAKKKHADNPFLPQQNREHNALARHLNALIPPSSHHQNLHPLHSIHTNTPLKNFPRKETEIRTLSAPDVTTLLKELDATDGAKKTDAGERKARLKEVIGVGERSSVVQNAAVVDGVGEKGKEEEKKKEEKKKVLPGKATGPPPGKVLPIGPKD